MAPLSSERSAPARVRNFADIQKILHQGETTNDLVKALGKPVWIDEMPGGWQNWHFFFKPFPAEGATADGTWVEGATVGVTNGRVAKWGYAYLGPPRRAGTNLAKISPPRGSSTVPLSLRIFVITNQPVAGGKYMDTKWFPHLGYIGSVPQLLLTNVTKLEAKEGPPFSVAINLSKPAALHLERFTRHNTGATILIMLDNLPVSAPIIMAPIMNGSFVIEPPDPGLVPQIRERLLELHKRK